MIGMPDIQNFFHETLAAVFAKLIYFRRKFSASFIENYHFPVAYVLFVVLIEQLEVFSENIPHTVIWYNHVTISQSIVKLH